ncbi:MAG: hypothetical protein H0X12_13300 [Nocardioides sp.]|nr:hypothetical protein [Nocardioides sp.]
MTNLDLLRETTAVMDAYSGGRTSFDELQAKFQSVMSLMERRPETTLAAEAIAAAEADLEYIRFMVFGDDVPGAVAEVLDRLRPQLEDAGRSPGEP